jgi:phosphate starvation-inducible PhoH-like protein
VTTLSHEILLNSQEEAIKLLGKNGELRKRLQDEAQVKIVDRGAKIVVMGDDVGAATANELLTDMLLAVRNGHTPTLADLNYALGELRGRKSEGVGELLGAQTAPAIRSDIRIRPRTHGQRAYLDAISQNEMTLVIGPAGTGKTYLAMAAAVSALLSKQVQRLVLTRPAVEAGENLGFLPGDLEQKVSPYLRPLYDALYSMVDMDKVTRFIEQQRIEVAPLAFMRGRTLDNAFVILDEAQNTTPDQMLMFLTRLGQGSRAVITGDVTQSRFASRLKVGADRGAPHPEGHSGHRNRAADETRCCAQSAGAADHRRLRGRERARCCSRHRQGFRRAMMKPRGNPRKGKKGAFQLAPQTDHDGGARRWRVQRLLEILAVVVIVAALTREPKRPPMLTEDINRTPVATEEIRAAISFETRDIEATRLAQEKAISDLPDIYRVESARVDEQLALVRAHITLLSEQRGAVRQAVCDALMASTEEDKPDAVARQAVAELAAKLKQRPEWAELPDAAILTEWLLPDAESLPERAFADVPAEPARTVAKGRNAEPTPTPAPAPRKVASLSPDAAGKLTFTASDALAAISLESLEYVLTAGVRVDTQGKAAAAKPVTLRRDRPVDDLPESSPRMPLTDIPALSGAAEKLSLRLQDAAKKAAAKSGQAESWPRLHEAARAMAEPALRDTLRYDMVATAEASERAKEAVPVVPRTIEAGEIIQDRGKRWTEQSREDVRAYLRELESDENPVQRVLTMGAANVLFALLAFAAVRRAISMYTPPDEDDAHRERDRRVNLALLLICVTLCVGRLASYFEPSGFVLPVAAPAILYAILVGGRAAVLVSCVTAMLLSAQYSFDWRLLCIGLAPWASAASFTIHNVRKRSDMAAASITATARRPHRRRRRSPWRWTRINSNAALQRGLLILMNGGLCLLVVPAVLSPLEKLFGITTDITLLEYSDLNNELLKRLAMEAPGT